MMASWRAHALDLLIRTRIKRRLAESKDGAGLIGQFGVGFYSTYTAVCHDAPDGIEISSDPVTGEVYALRGPAFAGVQFHPESVLTEHGVELLSSLVNPLVGVSL